MKMDNIEYIKYLDVAQGSGGWPLRIWMVDTNDAVDFPHFLGPGRYPAFKREIARMFSESFAVNELAWPSDIQVFWGPVSMNFRVTRVPTFRYEMSEL